MKGRIKNIAAGIGYVALFLGANLFVQMTISMVYGFFAGMEAAMAGEVIDQVAMTQNCMEYILTHIVVLTMSYQILALAIAWFVLKIRKKRFCQEVSMTKMNKMSILPLIVMGLAVQFFVGYGIMLLPISEEIMSDYILQSSSRLTADNWLFRILGVVIVAPIVEEVFFRGLVLSRFRKAMPLGLAIFLSSFLFGLMHGQLLWIAYTVVMGFLFSAVALSEKSIFASIILHMAINFSGLFVDMIPCEGIVKVIVCAISFVVLIATMYMVMGNNNEEKKETLEVA